MYAQDYDERTVCGSGYNGHVGGLWGWNWQPKIAPYMKNTQIFRCPSQSRGEGAYWDDYIYYSYAMPTHGDQSLAEIPLPAETVMTNDGVHPAVDGARGIAPFNCGAFVTGGWCDNDGVATEASFVHNGGDNVVFFDGHAKWLNFNTLRAGVGISY
jgi:hypothetical protein